MPINPDHIITAFEAGTPLARLLTTTADWSDWRAWLAAASTDPDMSARLRDARSRHAEAVASRIHLAAWQCLEGDLDPARAKAAASIMTWVTERVDPSAWAPRAQPSVSVSVTTNLVSSAAAPLDAGRFVLDDNVLTDARREAERIAAGDQVLQLCNTLAPLQMFAPSDMLPSSNAAPASSPRQSSAPPAIRCGSNDTVANPQHEFDFDAADADPQHCGAGGAGVGGPPIGPHTAGAPLPGPRHRQKDRKIPKNPTPRVKRTNPEHP